jgi:uncharacterized protein YheU (UPF0270 family)
MKRRRPREQTGADRLSARPACAKKDMNSDNYEDPILVDYMSLQPATLRSLIEDFVTRGGTDYGETEISLDQRIADVLAQLISGKAVVSFDAAAASATIILAGNSRIS